MKIAILTVSICCAPLLATPAFAQSTEEVLGAAVGGTAGAVVGGELDNKGSNAEGQVIGAVVGGALGYAVGDSIDDDNDRDRRREILLKEDRDLKARKKARRDNPGRGRGPRG